jgi:hypothetical protein
VARLLSALKMLLENLIRNNSAAPEHYELCGFLLAHVGECSPDGDPHRVRRWQMHGVGASQTMGDGEDPAAPLHAYTHRSRGTARSA